MSALEIDAITRLATVTGVDLNSGAAQTLYVAPPTKPDGGTLNGIVVTHLVIRDASTSLTTVSFSVGWNDADYNDVVADATHTELTGATLYKVLSAKAGAAVGTASGTLKLLCNTLQGAAATCKVEVFGYLC